MTDNIKLPKLPEPDICRYVVTVWRDGVECEIDKGPRYTVEQMQAYAREAVRLNAQAVPDAQEKDLLQAIRERDAADDYIDALLDEVLGTDRPEWSSAYGHADAMEQVRETINTLMKPSIDKAWDRFQSAQAAPAAPQPAQAVQAVPDVWSTEKGFRWDGERQHHVPQLLVEFEPVPFDGPCNAKGWMDRDAVAAMLSAAPAAPQPAQPLTDEQIDEIWQSRLIWSQRDIARAIEQAHGIGVKND